MNKTLKDGTLKTTEFAINYILYDNEIGEVIDDMDVYSTKKEALVEFNRIEKPKNIDIMEIEKQVKYFPSSPDRPAKYKTIKRK